ncbi:Extradiol ring-cleavage dioxygenase, class III enzyme, subunit B [Hyaloscypha sp. PMI_1271]|nr:Extradiol ring-cleavage dioxygenase, class III enzyme, subunit B [Hyaloscypha sp. PMI_1271]
MAKTKLTPVHFFSHGSTMMLGEESESAAYWEKCGDEALANNIKGVVIMGAHWDCLSDKVQVATNPSPSKSPVAYVHPSKYIDYKLNPDLPTANRCISILRAAGFNCEGNPTFDWIHDTYLILIRMFPSGCPPTTIISMNARFDPHFHLKIGSTLRPLRAENYLLIGSGGAVHNLYRNKWSSMLRYRDSFAQEQPPDREMLEFRQAVQDVMENNSGPELRRGLARLMKHPQFRDAHATDDHFMSALFVAGAAGDEEDRGVGGRLMAETWELTNMCNSQYTVGEWVSA